MVVRQGGVFRGWYVVAATFAILFAGFGCTYAYGAFFVSLETEFMADRAEVAAVFSYAAGLIFVSGAFSGPLSDKIGPRPVVAAGALTMIFGLWRAAAADSLAGVTIWFSVGLGLGLGFVYVPAIGAVQRWFLLRRGLASGVAVTGIGLGTFLMPIAAGQLLLVMSWREVFGLMSLLIGVLCLPAIRFLDTDPTAYGLHPDGIDRLPPVAADAAEKSSIRELVVTRSFVQLYVSSVILSFALLVPFVHLAPYAVDASVPPHLAATLVGLIGIGSTLGRLLIGGVADRIGRLRTLVTLYLTLALAYLWWLGATTYPFLAAFSVFYGIAYGASIALMPAILADYFGAARVGSIIGLQYTSAAAGSLFGPVLAGAIFDLNGSYTLWLVIGCILCVIAAALLATTPRPVLTAGTQAA